MLIKINDLVSNDSLEYDVDFDCIEVSNNPYLNRLENVKGYIHFYYDVIDKLKINYHLVGDFICPCAITLQDVDVAFDMQDEDNVIFDENDDGFYIYGDMNLEELVLFIVTPEIPIKVVKNKKIDYSINGEFSFVSEEQYESEKRNKIDPRLQKLKEYKFEEDD